MRLRIGPLSAFTAGYVLGAKAGRERYEQIVDLARKLAGTEPAQQLQAEVRYAANKAGAKIEEKASEGVSKVSGMVHHDAAGNGTPTGSPSSGQSSVPPS